MARTIKEIPVQQIILDHTPLNPQTLALTDYLSRERGLTPPIHVKALSNGNYKICDGRHRVVAFKLLGRKTIRAYIADQSSAVSTVTMPRGDSTPDL